jgi:hypothetical protein
MPRIPPHRPAFCEKHRPCCPCRRPAHREETSSFHGYRPTDLRFARNTAPAATAADLGAKRRRRLTTRTPPLLYVGGNSELSISTVLTYGYKLWINCDEWIIKPQTKCEILSSLVSYAALLLFHTSSLVNCCLKSTCEVLFANDLMKDTGKRHTVYVHTCCCPYCIDVGSLLAGVKLNKIKRKRSNEVINWVMCVCGTKSVFWMAISYNYYICSCTIV